MSLKSALRRFAADPLQTTRRVKMMTKGYKMITKKTGLTKRGDFRAKFETEGDPLYVCFPPHSFGLSGLVALMKMLRA